ncbi:MAG TPA: HlyD family efflux transporter periplasmic adaptor subunit [Myxococcota bacterium]|nr:HlyD family efflux transporter periplasmic adaptor subunit [Myxococcota bacterium]
MGGQAERDVALASLLRSQRQLSVLQQQLELLPSRRQRLEAELASQRASMRTAAENLRRASVESPIAGEIQTVRPRQGDWVAAGTMVARVVDLSRLEIPLKIPASAAGWVEQGDPVRIWIREPGGSPEQIGSVVRIAPEADVASRTMTVFVEVQQDPADADRLLPGQFVNGRVVTDDPYPRVVLPRRAVQSNTVYVAGPMREDGARLIGTVPVRVAYSFEARLPQIDPQETQWVALERGYEPVEGSPVAVTLLEQLVEGVRVRLERDPDLEPPEDEPERGTEDDGVIEVDVGADQRAGEPGDAEGVEP